MIKSRSIFSHWFSGLILFLSFTSHKSFGLDGVWWEFEPYRLIFYSFRVPQHPPAIDQFWQALQERYACYPTTPKSPKNQKPIIFLPGLNRNWLNSDPWTQELDRLQIPIGSFAFSLQAFSVAGLPPSQKPFFTFRNSLTLNELARETVATIEMLSSQLSADPSGNDLRDPIVVTLSYSGVLSPILRAKYSCLIDVAPMTDESTLNPSFDQYRKAIRLFWMMVPGGFDFWGRPAIDAFYYQHWQSFVTSLIRSYALPANHRENMVQGYVWISRIAEDQSWQKLPTNGVRGHHYILLAGQETKDLLANQIEEISRLWQNHPENLTVYLVPDAEHAIPSSSPKTFVEILSEIVAECHLGKLRPSRIKRLVIAPSRGPWQSYYDSESLPELLRWLD